MDLVTDAVAGSGKIYAILCGYRLQIPVVIGIFKAGLEGIMVHIGNTQLGFHPVNARRLQL